MHLPYNSILPQLSARITIAALIVPPFCLNIFGDIIVPF